MLSEYIATMRSLCQLAMTECYWLMCGLLQVGRYFKTVERNTTLFQELRAGTVTFLTVLKGPFSHREVAPQLQSCAMSHLLRRDLAGMCVLTCAWGFVLQIAYILSVNANILSDTGGPCTSADCTVTHSALYCLKFLHFLLMSCMSACCPPPSKQSLHGSGQSG